jgi:hypothetical protein
VRVPNLYVNKNRHEIKDGVGQNEQEIEPSIQMYTNATAHTSEFRWEKS